MKPFTACLSLLFVFSFCHAQYQGTITCKEVKPKAGVQNIYVYEPPANLLMPDKIQALIIYQNKQQFYYKTAATNKAGTKYQFLLKAPDSTAVIIIGMVDAKINLGDFNALTVFKKKILDNNKDAGFIFYLHDSKGERFADEKIVLAELLYNYPFELDVKATNAFIIRLFNEGYKLHPELKNEESYSDYLTLSYDEKGVVVKPQLLLYANKMEKSLNDETKWLNAVSIYKLLKMDEEKQRLIHKILYTYPNGKLAKNRFWNEFYNKEGETVTSIIDSMNAYIMRFNDSSYLIKDRFYSKIISLCLEKRDWASLSFYEQAIVDKSNIEYDYDHFAWKLCGSEIYSTGTDLELAKMLSKKSLQSIEKRINKLQSDNEIYENEKGAYCKYINTYALILYKLGQYDSAFYYQDAMYQHGDELNTKGLERYAAYAEKVKGINYTRQLLEEQLSSGVKSVVMLQQLQAIYKQLNLPDDEFSIVQKKSILLTKQKTAGVIKAKFGTTKAPNFVLKNILGQKVSLSSLTGKVVVLDFWATWCGPCVGSFPAMQEAIDKYKNDSTVVFLFIDVWEHKLPERMQKSTAAFMKSLHYNFNVLLDVDDKVVTDYKVMGIPAKFVIDKTGNIVFMGETSNIEVEIENARY